MNKILDEKTGLGRYTDFQDFKDCSDDEGEIDVKKLFTFSASKNSSGLKPLGVQEISEREKQERELGGYGCGEVVCKERGLGVGMLGFRTQPDNIHSPIMSPEMETYTLIEQDEYQDEEDQVNGGMIIAEVPVQLFHGRQWWSWTGSVVDKLLSYCRRRRYIQKWNVPEVASAHEIFKVPTINARFGTAPFFWNWTLSAFIKTMPVEHLKNKNIVQVFVKISYPLIRAADIFSGKKAAIRLICSVRMNRTHQLFSVTKHSPTTGTATAAFVLPVLEGSTMLGVYLQVEGVWIGMLVGTFIKTVILLIITQKNSLGETVFECSTESIS
ncbi:hypothetical protein CASFOL_000380 [Castilleja foliolosa]|uniref:Uncharacterized protein n=1 Tax=Castilleja foliolosa TaxID=1961234 RepID=A0ABD3ESH7_9LAMI